MSGSKCVGKLIRFLVAPILVFVTTLCFGQAQPPDSSKKTADSKAPAVGPPLVKLPDGTYLWKSSSDGSGEQVTMSLQEFQKYQDRIAELQRQIDARQKLSTPGECALRCRVEKQGEQLVCVIQANYSLQTTLPNTSVFLGGRKGFLVSAALDGNKLPYLASVDDGFTALIEQPGEHKLTVVFETPVSSRGAIIKTEVGFEIGLPRSAITTLVFDPPGPEVKRVSYATRTPDPTQPNKPADPKRAIDVKQLAARNGQEKGFPLGPVDSLELTWDPPAAAVPAPDQIQSAEFDVSTLLTADAVETTARIKLNGPAREWKVLTPPNTEVSVERLSRLAEIAAPGPPTPQKTGDANKPVWKIELPPGTNASEWVVIASTPQRRPRAEDPKYKGPFPIGPYTVLDVRRQKGTLRVAAGPLTQLTFKAANEVRQVPAPAGADEPATSAYFQLLTGPTGTTVANNPAPLLNVEAVQQAARVDVKPTCKLSLEKDVHGDGLIWRIRLEVRILGTSTTADRLALEIPAEWPEGAEASIPGEAVGGRLVGSRADGFWASLSARANRGSRILTVYPLPPGQKQPIDLVLNAYMRVPPGAGKMTIPLPRFPNAREQAVTLSVTVPEGLEIRDGETRGWDGDAVANWGNPLRSGPGVGPRRSERTLTLQSDSPVAQVTVNGGIARPDMIADVRGEVDFSEQWTIVHQIVRLRSVEGLPAVIHFKSNLPPDVPVVDLTHKPFVQAGVDFRQASLTEFELGVREGTKDLTLDLSFTLPHDRKRPDRTRATYPIGLYLPTVSSQTSAFIRVWSRLVQPRALTNLGTAWRELPPEPSPDRHALPSLTLAASAQDNQLPLAIEARDVDEPSAIMSWVSRSLIEVWNPGDGPAEVRARFLIAKRLTPVLEVRVPPTLGGTGPKFRIDGLAENDAVLVSTGPNNERVYRVRLPEDAQPGKSLTLRVQYQLPSAGGDAFEATYLPPKLINAAFTGPVRWQVTVPDGSLPVLISGAIGEYHWRWRTLGFAPTAARSSKDLDEWFRAGEEPHGPGESVDFSGESITARQNTPAAIVVYPAPRYGFMIACSAVVCLLAAAWRILPWAWSVPLLAVCFCTLGIFVVLSPHTAAQFAGAAQPGIFAAITVVGALHLLAVYFRHRATRLNGFARILIESTPSTNTLPTSSRGRQPSVGSGSLAPSAPTGV